MSVKLKIDCGLTNFSRSVFLSKHFQNLITFSSSRARARECQNSIESCQTKLQFFFGQTNMSFNVVEISYKGPFKIYVPLSWHFSDSLTPVRHFTFLNVCFETYVYAWKCEMNKSENILKSLILLSNKTSYFQKPLWTVFQEENMFVWCIVEPSPPPRAPPLKCHVLFECALNSNLVIINSSGANLVVKL